MSDFDMTEFEAKFEQRLRRYAEVTIRPIDADAVSRRVVERRANEGLLGKLGAGLWPLHRPAFGSVTLLIILGLILAIALAIYVGGALRSLPVQRPLGRNGLIAYEVRDIPTRPYNHVHVMKPDGTGDRELAQGSRPRFSGDGSTISYFSGWGPGAQNPLPPVLHVAAADGSHTSDIPGFGQVENALSADGRQIARIESGVITLTDVADGSTRTLVEPVEGGLSYSAPTWSPDGRAIAFAVMRSFSDAAALYQVAIMAVDLADGSVTQVSTRIGTDSPAISWSPDSKAIAFLALPDGEPAPTPGIQLPSPPADVFVVAVDGTGETKITRSAAIESDPEWSPGGSALAYLTFTGSAVRVTVVGLDGLRPITEPKLGPVGEEIEWSPDGTWLLFSHSTETTPANATQQQFRSTIQTVDGSFDQPPTTLISPDYLVSSATWQWLAP